MSEPTAEGSVAAPVIPTESSPRKLLVVLGASYGGMSITHHLLKHIVPSLANPAQYQVVLVSPSSEIVARPAMPRALVADDLLDQKKLFVPVTSVLEQYPAESWRFIHGAATAVDHAAKRLMVRPHGEMAVSEELVFHALVVATGATTRSPLLGLTTDADSLRASWAELRQALPEAKSIVIAGGGPAGIETAGELGQHLNGKNGGFFGGKKDKVAITVVTSGEQILPVLRPAIATQAEKLLAKLGVAVRKGITVTSTEPATSGTVQGSIAAKTVVSLSDGTTIDADIFIPATGFAYNTAFLNPALLQEDGRIKVNPKTLRIDLPESTLFYAVGDVSSAHRPAIHNLMDTIPVVAANLKRDLLQADGTAADALPAERNYTENTKEMQVVPIGTKTGVGAAMGIKMPGIMVKYLKGRDYFLWTTTKLWNGEQWSKAV